MSTSINIQLTSSLGNRAKSLGELKKVVLRPLLQLAVKAIEQEHIEDGILDRISDKYNVPQEKIDEWYSSILTIFRILFRSSNGPQRATEIRQILQELRMENDCIEDLVAVVYGHKRPVLINSLTEKNRFYPTLKSCRWRIDVTISSSSLSRVLEPTILMEWILSNGQRHIFEISLTKFHLLRHTIASLLLKMRDLETNLPKNS